MGVSIQASGGVRSAIWLTGVAAIGFCVSAAPLHAQVSPTANQQTAPSAAPDELGEIVVTAQHRNENVQNIPLAITALSGTLLRQKEVTDVVSIQNLAPSVQIGTGYGGPRIAIRGIGANTVSPGTEERVAYYLDGVYISRPEAILGTFFDIDRIEVLRGPQGTLYGRNSVAGTINVITTDPGHTLSGFGQLTVGNYSLVQTEAGLTIPLADDLSIRVAGTTADRSGYGKNLYNGDSVDSLHSRGARLKLKYDPGSRFSLLIEGDYFHERDSSGILQWVGPQYAGQDPRAGLAYSGIYGPDLSSNPRDQNVNVQPREQKDIWGVSATARWHLNGALTVSSITGYRHTLFDQQWDNDGSNLNIDNSYQHVNANQFSEELQLAGEFNRFHFVAGLYYFHENQLGQTAVPLDRVIIGLPSQYSQGLYYDGRLKTDSLAAYGQVTYKFNDVLSLDLGGRYSHEKKEKINERYQFDVVRPYDPTNPVIPSTIIPYDHQKQGSFDPKVTINVKAGPHALLYATYSRGFKSGGFNLGGLQPPFQAEKVTDYEGGIKAELFDGHLRANAAGFYYDYTNLQVEETMGQIETVKNAAAAKLYGAELEVTALPLPHVQMDFSGSVLHSRFTKFLTEDPAREQLGVLDLSGNHLPQAPTYTALLGLSYTWNISLGQITLRGEGNWVGRTYFTEYNLPEFSQKPYGMYNLFLNFSSTDHHWDGSVFVKNIGNGTYLASANQGSVLNGAAVFGAYSPPRTFGARVSYHF